MAEMSRYTQLMGFLVPGEEFVSTRLGTYSTATEAGPRPGVPIADQATRGVLEASGVSNETNYEVYCQEAGDPVSATMLWRKDLAVAENYRGWDPPHVVRASITPALSRGTPRSWDAARDSAGKLYLCTRPMKGVTQQTYETHTWDQTASWSAAYTQLVAASATYPVGRLSPALCAMPDVRMLAFLVHAAEGVADGYLQVSAWDITSGVNSTWSNNVLPAMLDNSGANPRRYGRMRAVYSNGLICLVIESQLSHAHATAADQWVVTQYVSSDDGATFRLVEDWETSVTAATGFARLPDLAVLADGRIVMVYQKDDTGIQDLRMRVIGSAFESFRNSEALPVALAHACTELTCWVDETGMRLMVAYNTDNVAPQSLTMVYFDIADLTTIRNYRQGITTGGAGAIVLGGYTYAATGETGSGLVIRHAADSAWILGLVCRTDATPAVGEWFHAIRLGGWRGPALPPSQEAAYHGRYSFGGHYGAVWDAHTLIADHDTGTARLDPDSQGWTLINTGWASSIASIAEAAAEWDFSGGAGQGRYSRAPTGPVDEGGIFDWECRLMSAGSVAAFAVGASLRLANGAKEMNLQIRMSAAAIRLWDVKAGAAIGADIVIDTSVWRVYRLAVYCSGATAYLKLWSWTEGASLGTLHATFVATVPASAVATNLFVFGHQSATTDKSRWRWLGYVMGAAPNAQTGYYQVNQGNPVDATVSTIRDLPGRPIMPEPCWLEYGLMLRGARGPFGHAETWSWRPAHDYPLTALSPRETRSPAEEWRSTSNGEQLFSWLFDDAQFIASLIAALFHRSNVRNYTIEGRTGAGAWTVLATVDACLGFVNLGYRRDGRELRAGGGATIAGRYLKKNELVGGYVLLKAGAGTAWRPITSNTEGIWRAGLAGYRSPLIRFSGSLAGLDTSGTTLCILPPSHYYHIQNRSSATVYDQIGIRITAGVSYEGYWRIGKLPVGILAIPGQRNAHGRIIGDAANCEIAEAPSGRRWCLRAGMTRRTAQVAWTDPMDLSEISTNQAPQVLTLPTVGVSPVATYRDVAYLMRGLLDEVQGARYPLVYLPRIPTTQFATTFQTSDPEDFLYGTITSALSRSATIGLEGKTEVVTVDGVTVEEEL